MHPTTAALLNPGLNCLLFMATAKESVASTVCATETAYRSILLLLACSALVRWFGFSHYRSLSVAL